MNHDMPAYCLWPLAIINGAVFIFFAFSFSHPRTGRDWRSFGAFSVRRGESDREAVRTMRQIVRDGHALGLFAEGTRQKSGVPGPVQPGAAMVAINEEAPVICSAIYGSFEWRLGNFSPVSLAWGTPMSFDGLPRGGKGYREASVE